jgi:hypothetical protein
VFLFVYVFIGFSLIKEIDSEVDKADTGLKGAIKKVNQLLESSKGRVLVSVCLLIWSLDSTQWAFIIILIVVLVGLIVLVFYV